MFISNSVAGFIDFAIVSFDVTVETVAIDDVVLSKQKEVDEF